MNSKKKGLLFLIVPIAFLALILSTQAITTFVALNQTASITDPVVTDPSGLIVNTPAMTKVRIINVSLGFLGIFAVIGIFIGAPLGIYFLTRKEQTPEKIIADLQKKETYKKLSPEQIEYITKWSWGAFFGQIFWALGNRLYLWALLFLVPFVNIYAWIVLSMDGRKKAWEEGKWESFEQFKKRQTTVAWVIFILFILIIVFQFALISNTFAL